MDEATLECRLLGSSRPSDTYAQPDFGRLHQELARKGATLTLLGEKYCAQVGDEHSAANPVKPWRYSQFCENYCQFAKRLMRSMRQVHRAGEKLFIDDPGPTIALVVSHMPLCAGSHRAITRRMTLYRATRFLRMSEPHWRAFWKRTPNSTSERASCFRWP